MEKLFLKTNKAMIIRRIDKLLSNTLKAAEASKLSVNIIIYFPRMKRKINKS